MDTPLHWIAFNLFVLLAVALDLGVFHRKAHRIGLREALVWSLVWVSLALGFGFWIYRGYGEQRALEYLTGYVIEKALSVDNLFVFLVVFRIFAVQEEYQHRVLGYGILGALLMRGAMIAAGAALVERFTWVMYLFGAFIIYAGLHMLFAGEAESHPERNFLVRYVSKHLRLTRDYREGHFFVRDAGKLFATPLFLVLLVVEITDVTFAVDSIPAIFGITRDPFIVYTSNVFAILGLRALYFLLAGVLGRFAYLKVGLGLVLVFVGVKMVVEPWMHISVGVSLIVVMGMLALSVLASLLFQRKKTARPAAAPEESQWIARLASADPGARSGAAQEIARSGRERAERAAARWWSNAEFAGLCDRARPTVGLAVRPGTFAGIRAANGFPQLADVPPDQDASEFALHFGDGVSLDVLTSRDPQGSGAIARFLAKQGEGVQQVEYPSTDVSRATAILRQEFGVEPVYPDKRQGADGTLVNFFLVGLPGGGKVLIELYQRA